MLIQKKKKEKKVCKVQEKCGEAEAREVHTEENWYAFKDALQVIIWAIIITFIWQNLGVRYYVP
jgi:hypothetical protein